MHGISQDNEVVDRSADPAITCGARLFDLPCRPDGRKIKEEWSFWAASLKFDQPTLSRKWPMTALALA